MRIFLRILLGIAVLLAVGLLIIETPPGRRFAVARFEEAVGRATGMRLSLGGLSGNLLTHARVGPVIVESADGVVLLEVAAVEARYNLPALARRRVLVSELVVQSPRVVVEIGDDGLPVGWPAAPADTAAAGGRPWFLDVEASIEDGRVHYSDSRSGLVADIRDLSVDAEGGLEQFVAAVACSVEILSTGMARSVEGRFEGRVGRSGATVGFESVVLESEVGVLRADGALALADSASGRAVPEMLLGLVFDGSLGAIGEVAGERVSGDVHLAGSVTGPIDEPDYRVTVESERVSYAAVDVAPLSLSLLGTGPKVELERLSAGVFGGTVHASGRLSLPGADSDGPSPFEFEAACERIDLAAVPPGPGEASGRLRGRLWASVSVEGDAERPFDALAALRAAVDTLAVGEAVLGPLTLSGASAEGRLTMEGECCGTSVSARARFEQATLRDVAATLTATDLSLPGRAFDLPDLAGEGAVSFRLADLTDSARLFVDADFPTLLVSGVEVGPVKVEARGRRPRYEGGFAAFDGAVIGIGSFEIDGPYEARVRVDSLDLGAVVRDSALAALGFGGSVDAEVTVAGAAREEARAEGAVDRLELTVSGETLRLAEPVSFSASPGSLAVTRATIEGPPGAVSVVGTFGPANGYDITAQVDSVDLGRAIALAGLKRRLAGGIVDADVRLRGARDDPQLLVSCAVDSLEAAGLVAGAVNLNVNARDSFCEAVAQVTGAAGGSFEARAVLPVVRDSVSFFRFDPDGPLLLTAAVDEYSPLIRRSFLPDVRGPKKIAVSAGLDITGPAGDPTSWSGSARLGRLVAEFGALSLSLDDSLRVAVENGVAAFENARINVVSSRALRPVATGALTFRGAASRDSLSIVATADNVDVGQLQRTFAPGGEAIVDGLADIRATLFGSTRRPSGHVSWSMPSPVVAGFGFDSMEGSARLSPDEILIERAALSLGDRAVEAEGRVELVGEGSGAPRLDLTVTAAGVDLSRVSKLPSGIRRIGGLLTADLRVTGRADAPAVAGALAFEDGMISTEELGEPVRGIRIYAAAADTMIALSKAVASVGDGAVSVSGFVKPGPDGAFWLRTRLRSAEFGVEEMFDSAVSADIIWAGSPERSRVSGDVSVEKLDVVYSFGLGDVVSRRPIRVVLRRLDDPRERVGLDVDVEFPEGISVRSNVARMELAGGFHVSGTAASPSASGGVVAEEGSFQYLDNEFRLETLAVTYMDPMRRDPYVDLLGTAEVESRSGELYVVTLRLEGFLYEAVPQLSSDPPLSEPDIVALLTFGETVGAFVSGETAPGSSGQSFSGLARRAFLNGLYGAAEQALERLLNLDTVVIEETEPPEEGAESAMGVRLGKEFGGRFRVDYETSTDRFNEARIALSLRLTSKVSVETVADPDGNHGIGLKFRSAFK